MASRADKYRDELRQLDNWEPYLKKHSGLPGPRANLELVAAVADEADADRLWRLSASQDEFLALCSWLRELASDPRWRVREGVAMALQRLGRESMPKLLAQMKAWRHDDPFVQRAVVAGLCEPALLQSNEDTVAVLVILDQITRSLAASSDRRGDGFRALRQALGYGWSIVAAAAPRNAQPYLEKWLRSSDKDVAWIMKSNLSKARMADLREVLLTPEPKRRVAEAKRKRG